MISLRALTLLSLFVSHATSFGGFDPSLIHHSVTSASSSIDTLFQHALPFQQHHHVATVAAPSPSAATAGGLAIAHNILNTYKESLAMHPLQTKMMTGAVLATAGDAIAQSQEKDQPYDTRRAASFATFDMAYRALQHISFPIIVEHCHGQFFTTAITNLLSLVGMHHAVAIGPEMTNNFAAMEQTLASQLGIVPFLYYPVFFGLTGFMQGLTIDGSIERAQEKFVPLMKRNLMFWLPVQFIQFGFIEENLQIPFLSVCGLAWTFILSIMAGSTKTYQSSSDDNVETEVAIVNADADVGDIGTTPAYQEQLASEDLGATVMAMDVPSSTTKEEEETQYVTSNDEKWAYEQR